MAKNREPQTEAKKDDDDVISKAAAAGAAAALKTVEKPEDDDPDDEKPDDQDDDASDTGADESKSDGDDDGEEGAADEKLGDEGDDEDPESKRARRRQEKKDRKERIRQARQADKELIESLTEQVRGLSDQVTRLSSTSSASQLNQIENNMAAHQVAYQEATKLMSQAMAKRDAAAFEKALEQRDKSRDAYNYLASIKQSLGKSGAREAAPAFDPRVISKAKAFASRTKWYDPNGRDEDSQIMLALDRALVHEGYDPKTDQYWTELETRAKRRLPHRYESERGRMGGGKRPKGKPGSFMPKGQGGVQDGRGATLSKERRQALLDKGLSPGSDEWNRHVASYQKWDKEQEKARA